MRTEDIAKPYGHPARVRPDQGYGQQLRLSCDEIYWAQGSEPPGVAPLSADMDRSRPGDRVRGWPTS